MKQFAAFTHLLAALGWRLLAQADEAQGDLLEAGNGYCEEQCSLVDYHAAFGLDYHGLEVQRRDEHWANLIASGSPSGTGGDDFPGNRLDPNTPESCSVCCGPNASMHWFYVTCPYC